MRIAFLLMGLRQRAALQKNLGWRKSEGAEPQICTVFRGWRPRFIADVSKFAVALRTKFLIKSDHLAPEIIEIDDRTFSDAGMWLPVVLRLAASTVHSNSLFEKKSDYDLSSFNRPHRLTTFLIRVPCE